MTTTRIAEPSSGRRLPLKVLAALVLLALSGLFLLAACGGDDEEGGPSTGETRTPAATASAGETQTPAETARPAAGELDPCALVTRADAEAVLGVSLGEPERQTTGPFETCIYSGETIENYVQVQVSDDVYTQGAFDDAMESAAEQLDTELEPVSGLGDKAYWFVDVLWIQKGDVTIDILVNTPKLGELRLQEDPEGEKQESLKLTTELAEKALEALP